MPKDVDGWLAVLLLAAMAGGLLAFFLYLRTSYRAGGWEKVMRDFIIAIVTILLPCLFDVGWNWLMHN